MDFDLNEEQKQIRETARKFARAELEPVAARLDQAGDGEAFLSNLKKLAGLGLMGLTIRPEYGGAGAGTVALSAAVTEIARSCASTAATTALTNMVCEVIQFAGSEAQKKATLPGICSGEIPAASFALTEEGAGSDPAGISTSAVLQGNEWVLNGAKKFITNAAYAGVLLVWAVTDPAAPKGKGISCFLVRAGTKGLRVGEALEKMGQHASVTNEVFFEGCRVPKSALLGELNDGFRLAMKGLGTGRIGVGSLALGIGLAAMDFSVRYARERTQFGQKITDFQAIQWMLADAYTELEAARLLLMQAASRAERDQPIVREAAMAKLYASEAANRACYTALQMMGGSGYSREFPVERYTRDVRVTSIYEGTSEIQRIVIAREILKGFS
jgi:alkylation response protein AidB-like acyl-CoA dehydrogenase